MRYCDLHTHTVFSDGINTIEEMVQGAIEKNMVSIGICDHSYTEFDLPPKHGFVDENSKEYRDMAIEALIACLEVTSIVEMNTGPVTRGWRDYPFPNGFLMKEILAHGGKIILSSDSHRADTLTGWFDGAVEQLRAVGFESTVVLQGGQFREVGI